MLLTSTGATSIMLEHADLEPVVEARAGRPLLIVDIAVPRDIDPSAADLPGVTLLDMDDLRRSPQAGVQQRRREVRRGRADRRRRGSRALRRDQVRPRAAAGRGAARPGRGGPPGRARAVPQPGSARSIHASGTPSRRSPRAHGQGPARADGEAEGRRRHAQGERLAEAPRDLYDLE